MPFFIFYDIQVHYISPQMFLAHSIDSGMYKHYQRSAGIRALDSAMYKHDSLTIFSYDFKEALEMLRSIGIEARVQKDEIYSTMACSI